MLFACNYKRKNYFYFCQKICIYYYKIEIYFRNNRYVYLYSTYD